MAYRINLHVGLEPAARRGKSGLGIRDEADRNVRVLRGAMIDRRAVAVASDGFVSTGVVTGATLACHVV